MLLRNATQDDASSIADAHLRSRRLAYAHFFSAEYLASLSLEQYVADWQSRIASPEKQTVVAELEGSVCGFAHFGEPGVVPKPSADAGLLDFLYVSPEYWRTGMGTALLAAAEGGLQSQGFRSAFLAVYEENQRARAFYERNGWSYDGTRWETERGTPVVQMRYVKDLNAGS